jgi:hypothetical protein
MALPLFDGQATPKSHAKAPSIADPVLVERVRRNMERFGYRQLDLKAETGISNAIISQWLAQKYKVRTCGSRPCAVCYVA